MDAEQTCLITQGDRSPVPHTREDGGDEQDRACCRRDGLGDAAGIHGGRADGSAVTQTQTMTLVGAGDIAGCDFKADRKTARLLGKIPGTVFTLGDNVYQNGTRAQFRNCYDPTWGKYKKRTRPSLGDQDYNTSGAKPYFDYFGWRAGKPSRGYYSYDRGSWHILALNSNCKDVGGSDWPSAQGRWLRRDLANHRAKCAGLLPAPALCFRHRLR